MDTPNSFCKRQQFSCRGIERVNVSRQKFSRLRWREWVCVKSHHHPTEKLDVHLRLNCETTSTRIPIDEEIDSTSNLGC